MLLAVVGFATVPALTGAIIAYGYVLVCPLGALTAPVRRQLFRFSPPPSGISKQGVEVVFRSRDDNHMWLSAISASEMYCLGLTTSPLLLSYRNQFACLSCVARWYQCAHVSLLLSLLWRELTSAG